MTGFKALDLMVSRSSEDMNKLLNWRGAVAECLMDLALETAGKVPKALVTNLRKWDSG